MSLRAQVKIDTVKSLAGATHAVFANNRHLLPKIGRWCQADPNASGLGTMAMASGGMGLRAGIDMLDIDGLYGDGASLCQYAGSSACTYSDLMGLYFSAAWDVYGTLFYQCPGCGRTYYPNSDGKAFLERNVEGRPIFVGDLGDLFIRGSLADELRLRERFEDLRLAKIPVLEKPRDRWTLPGDHGWDGVLRTPEGEIAPLAPYLREGKEP